jgi:hypothetical protein
MKIRLPFLLIAFFWPFHTWAIAEPVLLDLPEAYVAEVLGLFPEGKEIDPRLLDYQVDPNIHLHREARIAVTFLHEGAAFRNSFGYFLYDDQDQDGAISAEEILKKETLFADVISEAEGGTLAAGDTVNLGKFPKKTHLGFFLIVHGRLGSEWTFYTIDALNFDGHRHLAMRVTPDGGNIALGIEDLPWDSSDRDFNDIIFSFTITPKEALQEVIEEGNIPGAPTPSPSPAPSFQEPAKVFEAPAQQIAEPAFSLEGGGMRCSLNKEMQAPKNVSLSWFWASFVLSFLGIRILRVV